MNNTYFSGKVVWVTGASSGIGKALALKLAQNGANLILSARNQKALEEVKLNCKNPENHLVLPLDLTKNETFTSAVEKVKTHYGRIDILVNNGGVSQRATAVETDLATVRQLFEVDFFGHVALTNLVVLQMREKGRGQILVISSIAGKFGFFLRSSYSAAKHALHGYFESLALEEEKSGIQVTIACPGKINTPISTNALTGKGASHGKMDDNQAGGMPVEECAEELLKALQAKKREVLIGKSELLAVYLKRFFPGLFWRIIRKQSAT
jgi:dehydrogenase/reductase SDR family protein 7B